MPELRPCERCDTPTSGGPIRGRHWCAACTTDLLLSLPQPINLNDLMSGEPPEADWLIEPILPRHKLTLLTSWRGIGKSLLALNLACDVAAGAQTIATNTKPPMKVLYMDYEMGPDDLYERLDVLAHRPGAPTWDEITKNLIYLQLPDIPPLDTAEGGETMRLLLDWHQPELVIIDTTARVISGDENAADTFRELFRHTESEIKRRHITYLRLDHMGKDKTRGTRGASGKEDPMDVVWHYNEAPGGMFTLTRTKGRMGWVPETVELKRHDDGERLTHDYHPQVAAEGLVNAARWLLEAGAPETITRRSAREEYDIKVANQDWTAVKRIYLDMVHNGTSGPGPRNPNLGPGPTADQNGPTQKPLELPDNIA